MPKIVKNGLEYSGTPLEEVTAWPPTGDSVQIEQPLMGNTDISEVGDGTVTGAIDALNNGLMHAETKTISVNDEGKTVIFNDISKIPVLIANQTSEQYPLFLPYLYGGAVRARVIDFSSNSWSLVQNVTLTVIVYYINNPQ